MWNPESERRGWKQRKVLCIQLLKSCSTPWWQTNKQNPCLFFSAQWLQQTHSASFRLARQLALLTKTNSRDVFFFFYISFLILRLFHTLTYFLTISQGIFVFPLLLFQACETAKTEEWGGGKIMKVYCTHRTTLFFQSHPLKCMCRKETQETDVTTATLICLRAPTRERCLWCYLGVIQTRYFQNRYLPPLLFFSFSISAVSKK